MNPEFKPKQLSRLLPETMTAIDKYRRAIKKQTGRTPSINGAINSLILIGFDATQNDAAQQAARAVASKE